MKISPIAAALLLCYVALGIQSNSLNGQNAPRAFRTKVQPNWNEDESLLWYRVQIADRLFEHVAVDTRTGDRHVFPSENLATAFSKVLEKKVTPTQISLQGIRKSSKPNQYQICFRNTWYDYHIDSPEVTRSSTQPTVESPFFLPVRASVDTGGETRFQIENQLKTPIQMVWIDRSGNPQGYGNVDPGKTLQQHTFNGHIWLIKSDNKDLAAFEVTDSQYTFVFNETISVRKGNSKRNSQSRSRRSSSPRFHVGRRAQSPDRKWRATVSNNNLFLKADDRDDEIALTNDATDKNTFSRDASRSRLVQMAYNQRDPASSSPTTFWSADSKYVVAAQTSKVSERRVHYVESSPRNQVQPVLRNYTYAKPGDEIPQTTFRLFESDSQKEIPIDRRLMDNPFELRFLHWNEDASAFYLYYNQRGHQVIRILKVDVSDGKVTPIVDEKSETFIHYSTGGKMVQRWLPDNQLLWASERSGWNHLYLYNTNSGEVVNAVTQGEWNVKRIVNVDNNTKTIWFYAVGIRKNQDPYHEHLCRVNFDGSDMTVLTDGDGMHNVAYSPQQNFLVDRYSRVDMPTVTELRRADNGKLICELERGVFTGTKPGVDDLPTRFVAKGRDGKTDIYGIIHFPKNFDPKKTYPIVENIYAGPHNYHVPKSFGRRYYHQRGLADQGMFVVQIDGMGTAWRSKAFHDKCFKNLKDAGFPDRIAWIQAAAKQFPQMDTARVGIYGGSAGGQNAMAALIWHNDFYKVAVADCGCHDNRMDKIWWNEQWMGWPVDDSYAKNSNTENAHRLKGNLMLVVGELDRNVDPASTTQVVHRLIKANIDFEFVLVAGAGHGACETPWASRKRSKFLTQHLQPESERP